MPDIQAILVITVVVAAMALFITEKLRVDLIALCVLLTLIVLGLLNPDQALYGFANQATATIVAMFVLSAGLERAGLVGWLARRLDSLAGKTEPRLIIVICIAIAFLSAFMINTAAVAVFIPIAIVLAKTRKISASRVLIPLSFASQFGGVCTLIGTSTNILVNSIAVDKGMKAFTFFEFAPLGLAMTVVGIAYLILARRLLPKRKSGEQQVDRYHLADYLAELQVTKKSSLIGTTWMKSKLKQNEKVNLIKFIRNDKATTKPPKTKIREDDILLLHGNMNTLIAMQDKYRLRLHAKAKMDDKKISSDEIKLVEVLIPPRSRLVGQTLQTFEFFRRFGCIVFAVQRRGKTIRDRVAEISLNDGDTLLLEADKEVVSRLLKSHDLIVTNEVTELYVRKDKAIVALLMFLAVVTLTVLHIIPILVAALIGAIGMVLGRCLTIEEAYEAIDWKVIFLLGGILPLGLAMEQSGAALWMTNTFLSPFLDLGPLVVLAIIYLITAILTEAMSNNAAAIILVPIGMSVAATMNVDARPFLVAITFAASTSFATPIGYQTNTMIYSPGGYRFTDFTRVGTPLNLIFWGLAVLLIPLLWPF
ncbi:MAG: SLC13 family permease [Candidatus Scalindua rubra]|uniref:Putative Sulfur Deprivation Response Regulator n=1 Tax=Candidatus Scalindua brodae TaxID=237368 RepID=A0A0B0ECQ8_9BACT|nr:MAG: putative Sulfur Deprivation Response Regulator [Candidatus Scalindua brodae]MBZ0109158.1 SLC13 family permease [Candidatus Scalindua rubra]TWU33595.1 Sodium-dependent dicarboxylate transporter SdcS [Candidatus Brocadiaceae bacterium S225]